MAPSPLRAAGARPPRGEAAPAGAARRGRAASARGAGAPWTRAPLRRAFAAVALTLRDERR